MITREMIIRNNQYIKEICELIIVDVKAGNNTNLTITNQLLIALLKQQSLQNELLYEILEKK